jgi:hypothetical protein
VITCTQSYQLNIRRKLPETTFVQYHQPIPVLETVHRTGERVQILEDIACADGDMLYT